MPDWVPQPLFTAEPKCRFRYPYPCSNQSSVAGYSLQGCNLLSDYVHKFVHKVHNKTVRFVGDSLIGQAFKEMTCRIGHLVDFTLFFNNNNVPNGLIATKRAVGKEITLLFERTPQWFPTPKLSPDDEGGVHPLCFNFARNQTLLKPLRGCLRRYKTADIVVLSLIEAHFLGNYAHLCKFNCSQRSCNLEHQMKTWQKYVSIQLDADNFNPIGSLYIVSPTPSHWISDGNHGGNNPFALCPDPHKPSSNTNATLESLRAGSQQIPIMMKYVREVAIPKLRQQLPNATVVYVDVYGPLLARWDAHPYHNTSKGPRDCLHWCQPGPLSVWLQLLTTAMYNPNQFEHPYKRPTHVQSP
eukprot:TRINITY_DN29404_c0_g1_i1.p1 TRINITY_DN29404_c0_g1~~TRINITY_DN29404_c0_g1_i1.p1  ORF type:complete len:355 (+),score=4.46 TRINITY_DN29404_c0_g1_i1:246-1310(+)